MCIFGKTILMQETWTFDYSDSLDLKELSDFLIARSKDLGIFLSYYYKREGALAENVDIKTNLIFETQTSGNFTLEFDLIHFNACLAIDEKERSEMKIKFELNPDTNQLILTGAYWPERGMDEI